MNFFAHSCMAATSSEAPRFLLGAMLPDLVGMMGVRIEQVHDHELRAGIAHHHEVDAAFHGAPIFTELCSDGITTLGERGVERGTARAVAHVGTEMLLDGVLSGDAAACRRYRGALEHAHGAQLGAMVSLRAPEELTELQVGVAQLALAPVPEGYRSPEFAAARLRYVLSRRPRLAMRAGDEGPVLDWLHRAHGELVDRHDLLLAQVHGALQVGPRQPLR